MSIEVNELGSPKTVVLHNCSIINVINGKINNNSIIVIQDGKITYVGSETESPQIKPSKEYDVKNLYVIPGLIDLHTHISFDGSPSAWSLSSLLKDPVGFRAIKATLEVRKYLESGFTTIRDLGSFNYEDLAIKRAINEGLIVGPNVFTSGKALSMTGGHGDLWVREELKSSTFGLIVDGVENVRFNTRKLIKLGVDWIKILGTGGVASEGDYPDSPQFTYEELLAATYEAHSAKRYVAIHAHGPKGIELAIKAGADSIEHGSLLAEKPELATQMMEKSVALVPTLAVTSFVVKRGSEEGLPDYAIKKTEAVIGTHKKSVKIAKESKVLIAVGTDSGYMVRHGESAWELKYLVEAGLNNLESLQAGTINAAKVLRIDNYYGSVEQGKIADLVVVKVNPLENIEGLINKENIVGVFKKGELLVNRGL
jgi:imidazolonepropionase-like amidohydrolase